MEEQMQSKLYQLSLRTLLMILVVSFTRGALAQAYERRDVTFASQGLKCAAWYYVPKALKGDEKRPAIVMAHGWSATKEMYLDNFASKFANAGFIVLVFDYRFLGASEGEPRGQLLPADQHEDYRNAISWVSLQKEVDANRIGIWGTSYSGAHVLQIAAYDRRVRAVVSQVPGMDSWELVRRNVPGSEWDGMFTWLASDRLERYKSGKVNYIPVVAEKGPSSLPQKESYEWFTRAAKLAPRWQNQVTVETLEKSLELNPAANIHHISPTPLLMLVASDDIITPTDQALAAFDRALQPKQLVLVKGRHFDAYDGAKHQEFAQPAVEWFKRYLMN
jgi:uncharacterized protein